MPVDVLIPALDEVATIAAVVRSIPRDLVRTVMVADNGSTDGTAEAARSAGAQVVQTPRRGYGEACLTALAALPRDGIVVFMVADGSDDASEIPRLIAPIVEHGMDLVIGSRMLGTIDPGAMTDAQRWGSRFAAAALSARFGTTVTDLGPFRAIRRDALDRLHMVDRSYGWTIEMQIKAARAGLSVCEVPVSWKLRAGGTPKVSGTLRGTLGASRWILAWLRGALLGPAFDPVVR